MKKLFTLLLVLILGLSMVACGSKPETTPEDPVVDYNAKSEGVMTYAEFAAVPDDNSTKVTIEGYVQAAQSYWNGAKLYVQDLDGAYFVYCDGKGEDVNISEEDYAKLVANTNYGEGWSGLCDGTKVKVTGYKTAWSGEVEIGEATVEIEDGPKWVAEAIDLTDKFADVEALLPYINQKVKFTGLTVEEAALYNWDGSGVAGSNSDLYITLSNGTASYSFTVESYLMYEGSDVYNAVLALQAGDTVEVEGFLYWYNAPQLHITAVK